MWCGRSVAHLFESGDFDEIVSKFAGEVSEVTSIIPRRVDLSDSLFNDIFSIIVVSSVHFLIEVCGVVIFAL